MPGHAPRHVAAAVALSLLAAGCGDREPAAPLAPVRLAVEAPRDGEQVRGEEVEVRGRVWPAKARVLVNGEEVSLEGRTFGATVSLEPGANVVDVVAGAPGRRSVMTAVRVTRVVEISVPDVSGQSPDEAARILRRAGFVPRLRDRGGVFEDLLPGRQGVCGTDPGAGERAWPGSEVEVAYSKIC